MHYIYINQEQRKLFLLKLDTYFQKQPSQLIIHYPQTQTIIIQHMLQLQTFSQHQMPSQNHSPTDINHLDIEYPVTRALEPKSKQQKTNIKKKSRQLIKMQPYIQAIRSLRDVDLDDQNAKNPLLSLNSTIFWYWMGAQYFFLDHLHPHKHQIALQETSQKIKNKIGNVTIMNRIEKRKLKKQTSQNLKQYEDQKMIQNAEHLGAFFNYFQNINKLSQPPIEVHISNVKVVGQSTCAQDEMFMSSTVTIVYKLLRQKMKTHGFNALEKYYQAMRCEGTKLGMINRVIKLQHNNEILNEQQGRQQEQFEQYLQEGEIIIRKQHLLISMIMRLPLDNIISLLQESIPSYQLPSFDEKISIHELYMDQDDPLNLVATNPIIQQAYITKMKQKVRNYRLQHPIPQIQVRDYLQNDQDLPCQICFSGDYEQNNLIVMCSLCNIPIHQHCIQMDKIPQNNWICQVCQAFGPAGINLPCPLCPIKGGAMKRCNLPVNLYKCSTFNQYYHSQVCHHHPRAELQVFQCEQLRIKEDVQLLYNYFKIQSYPKDLPKCNYVWAHYSCLNLHDQCYYVNVNQKIMGCGIEKIAPQRYGKVCLICNKANGVVIKCHESTCLREYHSECAKRNYLIYELPEKARRLQKEYYMICCQEHRPYELQQKVSLRHRRSRLQIRNFAQNIAKYVGFEKFRYKLPPIFNEKKISSSQLQLYENKGQIDSHGSLSKHYQLNEEQKQSLPIEKIKARKLQRQKQQFTKLMQKIPKMKRSQMINHSQQNGIKLVSVQYCHEYKILLRVPHYIDLWDQLIQKKISQENAFKSFQRFMRNKREANLIKKIILSNNLEEKMVTYSPQSLKQFRQLQKQKHLQRESHFQQKGRTSENSFIQIQKQKKSYKKLLAKKLETKQHKLLIELQVNKKNQEDCKNKMFQSPKHKSDNYRHSLSSGTQTCLSKQLLASSKQAQKSEMKGRSDWRLKKREQSQENRSLSTQNKVKRDRTKKISKRNKKYKKKRQENSYSTFEKLNITQQSIKKVVEHNIAKAKPQKNAQNAENSKAKNRLRKGITLDKITYCVCETIYDDSLPMIACEQCDQWFHFDCIGFKGGINKADKLRFLCVTCLGIQTKGNRKKLLKEYYDFFRKNSSLFECFGQMLQEIRLQRGGSVCSSRDSKSFNRSRILNQ